MILIYCCGTCARSATCTKDRDEYDFPCPDWVPVERVIEAPEMR